MTGRKIRLTSLSTFALMSILFTQLLATHAARSPEPYEPDLLLFTRDVSPAGSDPRHCAMILNLRTGREICLTPEINSSHAYSWSHDGMQVLAGEFDGYAGNSLFVSNADGTNRRWLTDSAQILVSNQQWSSDDQRIIFWGRPQNVDDDKRFWAIFDIAIDGTDMRRLTPPFYESGGSGLAITPDGSTIIFRHSAAPGTLFTMPASGGDITATPVPLDFHSVNLAPDGSQLAVVIYSPESGSSIYLMTPDGREVRLLVASTPDMDPYSPVWSPDGSDLMFLARAGKNGVMSILGIVNVATGAAQYYRAGEGILASLMSLAYPVWSADGTQIVLSGGTKTYYSPDLYLVDRGFTRIQPLGDKRGINSAAQWRPAAK